MLIFKYVKKIFILKIKHIRKPIYLKNSAILFCLYILFCVMLGNNLFSQEIEFKRSSIKTGIGIGMNVGLQEIGNGIVYSIGWQKSFGTKNKIRLNPNLTFGGFLPLAITDTRDQFYRITALDLNIHYDLIKYKAVSIVVNGGGFINYSRGLLGTGGWPEEGNNSSEYFYTLYGGGNASVGLRINPKKSKLAYEIRPFNFYFGNKRFFLAYFMIGVDFKLAK